MIQIHEVIKTFDGKEVLRNLNLNVERGTIYGLLGANGAGKTTTFKLISGLLQPTAGTIRFDGEIIQTQNKKFLKEMGVLIETPVFYEHLSARENLEIHLAYMGCDTAGITDEVLDFIRQNPAMLAPVRKGNKLICMAFPCNMNEYIKAESSRMKRYHACHCPFAKESILADETVSPTLCYCSLGHVMNFSEAFLGRELEGRVVRSVLNGDLTCEYEAAIPEDIMSKYLLLSESQMVIENYYRYYRIFALSGIVEFHEGPVNWIVPKRNEVGPSLAFHIRLSKSRWQEELDELMEGIRSKSVPARWLITPDAEPNNIVLCNLGGFHK